MTSQSCSTSRPSTTAIATRGYEGKEDVVELLDAAEKSIFEISESRLRQGFLPVREILRGTFEMIQKLYDDKSHLMGTASGFIDLDAMTSGFQDGDLIIVSPNSPPRRGDRVVAKTRAGEVLAKVLQRQTASSVELASFNPEHETRIVPASEIEWLARIVWASQ